MRNLWRLYRNYLFLLIVVTFIAGGTAFAIDIIVVTTTGKTLHMNAEPEDTVGDVKQFVFNAIMLHAGNQRMYKGSQELENDKTLASYKVADGDTLYVKLGTGGGKRAEEKSGAGLIVLFVIIIVGVGIVLFKTIGKKTSEQ